MNIDNVVSAMMPGLSMPKLEPIVPKRGPEVTIYRYLDTAKKEAQKRANKTGVKYGVYTSGKDFQVVPNPLVDSEGLVGIFEKV